MWLQLALPSLFSYRTVSREMLKNDRDTWGICQACFCFHLLESGNDLTSQ